MSNTENKSPARIKLDRIDRRIISDLQNDGRMTNVDLAKRAGISAPPCLRRVRNLEEMGLIKSYHARVDAAALGFPVTVFTAVKLAAVGEGELKKFEEWLEKWPMVREAYMMTGDNDFLLKIVARDWDDYQTFLTQHLVNSPNVVAVKSSLSIKVSKLKAGVPISTE
ncbi:MAG: Lrp/AsnC family transcriptional regulator [Alphaproteobacteria bacterium]|nr:Lrp/AsnC family transcriptional regulator [Alphaproteobacteria bacterium]MBP9868246.1 Lrp/AsnC family transcriptional regulator [Alphaproteobacteria bacterium]